MSQRLLLKKTQILARLLSAVYQTRRTCGAACLRANLHKINRPAETKGAGSDGKDAGDKGKGGKSGKTQSIASEPRRKTR